jgi:hypothetical protein
MTLLSPVEVAARPSRLDQHVARMVGDEPTLTEVSAVLQLLADADEVDGVRIQALCHLAARALGKFSSDVRAAPAEVLNDVVKVFATSDCKAAEVVGCDNEVTEWTSDDGFCGPSCRVAYMGSQNETWRD